MSSEIQKAHQNRIAKLNNRESSLLIVEEKIARFEEGRVTGLELTKSERKYISSLRRQMWGLQLHIMLTKATMTLYK